VYHYALDFISQGSVAAARIGEVDKPITAMLRINSKTLLTIIEIS